MMDRNPYADRIFTMAAHLSGAQRTSVGIALIMTEAQIIAKHHPALRAHMESVLGNSDWLEDDDKKADGTMVVIAFFQFMRTGGLKHGYEMPNEPSTATIEA